MKSYFDLTGRTALVTGGSSHIGKHMSAALGNQGASVVLLARDEERVHQAAEDIRTKYDIQVQAVSCDISDPDEVDETIRGILTRQGAIDILVNNAGTGFTAPAEEVTDAQFEGEMDVDLFGTFRVTRAVAKYAMIPKGYGRIINISSVFGLVGNMIGRQLPYEATKGALVNMTRALAAEWSQYGITVNCVCPGYFKTPYTAPSLETADFKAYSQLVIPEERYGEEGELDTTVIYLSSPFSSYVTGVSIPVDGGFTAL